MFLAIEIGGTKLQLALGHGNGTPLVEVIRREVRREHGAAGILDQILEEAPRLVRRKGVRSIGIGFGGPVDAAAGQVITSHQISGWDGLALVRWCDEKLGLPAVLGNDCDCSALAEARFGAGAGQRCVFYTTVGTGVGGGLVVDGHLHGGGRPAVAEIGHLRPGLDARSPGQTVESLASGPGLTQRTRLLLAEHADSADGRDLLGRCEQDARALTARVIGEAARSGNRLAGQALEASTRVLGWALAQVITLVAPEVVVIGGGVSLIGETHFFAPLRRQIADYVFPPLRETFAILPAALGEEVVLHGALALAAQTDHADE